MKKLLLIIGICISLPCFGYEFCSDNLSEGCIGYEEGVHHLETFESNGNYFIKIVPLKGYDFYKKIIPYGKDLKKLYYDFDRNTDECMKYDNPNMGLKDVDAYYDKVNKRPSVRNIDKYVSPYKVIDLK